MSLASVKMSEEVWLTCLTHALSTETEEIMGLLLGDIEVLKNGIATALIWGASPQTRSDRRKDRVETNPEQLAAASAQAEHRMTISTGRRTRVIGWYHSHPHITVLPSHVDVRTQKMFQLLDSGFIGLIFSCFNEDANKVGRIQVIAFQSSDGKLNHDAMSSTGKSSVMDLESSSSLGQAPGDEISSNLGGYFKTTDANYPGKEMTGGNYQSANLGPFVDVDPMDMSEGMQEAMHRSTLDVSNSEFIRKEIPLLVLPTSSLLKLESPLRSFMDLQRVLYEEERAAYNQAIIQNTRNGKVHPLTFIHHTSTYQASVCKLMEYCLTPAISALEDRLRENEIRLEVLRNEAKFFESREKDTSLNSGSPRQKLRISSASPHSRSSGSVHGDPQNPAEPIKVRGVASRSSRSERGAL